MHSISTRMKRAVPAAACLLLAACSGSPQSNVTLGGAPPPGQGSAFLLEGEASGNYGEAFLDANGNGFMAAGPSDGQAAQALYRIDGNTVQRAPAPAPSSGTLGTVSVVKGSSMALRMTAVTPSQLAGRYAIQVDGAGAEFTVAADGVIAASGTGCQLTGQLSNGASAGTLALKLTVAGCAAAGSYEGYAVKAADYLPSAFRVLADNGKRVLDGFAVGR